MPPSRKQIDIFEALKELGERTLRGDFGRGDDFDETLYSVTYEELLLPSLFPDLEEENVPHAEAVAALDEALAEEKKTGEWSNDVLNKAKELDHNVTQASFPPEGVEDAEETAEDSREKKYVSDDERWPIDIADTGPAEDATETQVIDATEIGSVEDVLGEEVDGSK